MIQQAYAKVNIFLKIVGKRGEYHELVSRFMRVENLFDTLIFAPKKTQEVFELRGDFDCPLEKNTIFRAYQALRENGFAKKVDDFFSHYALHVEKKIPTFAGLGGGSSDAATFLNMTNKNAQLGLSVEQLANIGSKVGADVPFFVYDFSSANVSGIGEKVVLFDEEPLDLEVVTPSVFCDTKDVYRAFREHFYNTDEALAKSMEEMSSKDLLQTFTCRELNDLFEPCEMLHEDIKTYSKEGWFFSGSGSSFFRIRK
ncbi:MAG: 4-(cytidine 5'-diphospho)-2-C-methyl-D-erythritol kinase [Sulfurospirillaceae bacterium]|nr:4-(cytidine 5'-diphospho)-2-C-methyl-D-erythritol kinase [Sulfurospirillaceae bacterium]